MMSTPNQELPLDNPRKWLSDNIPIFLKVFIKEKLSRTPHHHLIIPATTNHTSWTLGAQPGWDSMASLTEKNTKKVHIISMITKHEMVIDLVNQPLKSVQLSRLPWLDHGTISLTTGKNQTVKEMREFQDPFYNEFNQPTSLSIPTFYCHCMAGRSRSFVETMTFIYFHPDKKHLFDFDHWPPEITEQLSSNLKDRLQNHPSFSDIAELVRLRRSKAKKLDTLDGDQRGLLGLMMLDQSYKNPDLIATRKPLTRLYRDAQNIGMVLAAPLDVSFRDPADRQAQETNLIKVYRAYQERGINLLTAMVAPLNITLQKELNENDFFIYFNHLNPNEQAHFAICLNTLENQQPVLELGFLRGKSAEYAKIAIRNTKKLTAGDQVELLKTFGPTLGLGYNEIAKKILNGNAIDRYNAGAQLAELSNAVKKSETEIPLVIKQALNELNDHEAKSFRNLAKITSFQPMRKMLDLLLKKKPSNILPHPKSLLRWHCHTSAVSSKIPAEVVTQIPPSQSEPKFQP